MEFIQLINQLINKFETRMMDIHQEIFPFVVSRFFALLPQDGFPEGSGCLTEVIIHVPTIAYVSTFKYMFASLLLK
jgi:hypothetical protein